MSEKREIDVAGLPHYSVKEWEKWEGEWELIDGIPYAMSPMPSIRHQVVNGRAFRHFADLLDTCSNCSVYFPVNLLLDEFTVLHPDLVVSCGESEKGVYLENVPELVMEILSPSTALKDRNNKMMFYAQLGVRWCLLVDPVEEWVEIWQLQEEGTYDLMAKLHNESYHFDFGDCNAEVDFSKFW